jgi:hypothetical protein
LEGCGNPHSSTGQVCRAGRKCASGAVLGAVLPRCEVCKMSALGLTTAS